MAAPTILIGIDAGTSVIKSVAFDLHGRQIAEAARPNHYDHLPNGGVVQDMARTFTDTVETLKALVAKLPGGASSVAAIAVTGQGDGTWLVDAAGEPVAPAWLWLDARAGDIATECLNGPDYRRQFETTGTGINPCQQSTQLLHMKRSTPDWLAQATSAFHCKDWLYFKLTGIRAVDPSEATFTFGDFRTRDYSDSVIDGLGLSAYRHLLPPIVDGRKESHPLSPEAARATGLLAGTPIVLGYVDVVCTAVGGGLISRAGDTGCSILGSTGMHMRYVRNFEDAHLNADGSGYVMVLPSDRAVAQIQSNMAATLNIDFLLDLADGILREGGVDRSRADLVARLDTKVLGAPPLAAIYHPYISEAGERGPFMDPLARANFTGLVAGTGFDALMRSVFEGLGFAARDCFEATGAIPAEVRLTGGAARSKAMRKILASILGTPVRTTDIAEAGAAGAAMIALVQQGHFADIGAAANSWVTPRLSQPTSPDATLALPYAEAFALYRDLSRALRPAWARLATIKRGLHP
ncbi:carbohydrate kinase [Jiella sp. MQZ9-1]|uniref:Carbohydrate kinase n=1 Tax=Jiella flava TaxID=2816857 RepID=A0A939FV49_9HYPH|nr:FGGY-family carbohydrate kinase [Jiella flava]MBO0662082.1 carbohydrate kinase [Jiella flava]MCD2470590.1 carbohydrate kinase [Jiella flava]